MSTNDERREVAETLRRLTASEYDGEFFDCGEVEAALGLVTDDGSWYEAAGVRRLADLIEPESERTCHIIEQVETGPTSSGKVHRCFAAVVGFEFTGQMDGSGSPGAVVLDNGLDVFDKRYEQRDYVPSALMDQLAHDNALLIDRNRKLACEVADLKAKISEYAASPRVPGGPVGVKAAR